MTVWPKAHIRSQCLQVTPARSFLLAPTAYHSAGLCDANHAMLRIPSLQEYLQMCMKRLSGVQVKHTLVLLLLATNL